MRASSYNLASPTVYAVSVILSVERDRSPKAVLKVLVALLHVIAFRPPISLAVPVCIFVSCEKAIKFSSCTLFLVPLHEKGGWTLKRERETYSRFSIFYMVFGIINTPIYIY